MKSSIPAAGLGSGGRSLNQGAVSSPACIIPSLVIRHYLAILCGRGGKNAEKSEKNPGISAGAGRGDVSDDRHGAFRSRRRANPKRRRAADVAVEEKQTDATDSTNQAEPEEDADKDAPAEEDSSEDGEAPVEGDPEEPAPDSKKPAGEAGKLLRSVRPVSRLPPLVPATGPLLSGPAPPPVCSPRVRNWW